MLEPRMKIRALAALVAMLVGLLAGCSGKTANIVGNPAVTGAISFGSSQACAEWAAKNPDAAANAKVYIAGVVQAGESCLAGIDATTQPPAPAPVPGGGGQ